MISAKDVTVNYKPLLHVEHKNGTAELFWKWGGEGGLWQVTQSGGLETLFLSNS